MADLWTKSENADIHIPSTEIYSLSFRCPLSVKLPGACNQHSEALPHEAAPGAGKLLIAKRASLFLWDC